VPAEYTSISLYCFSIASAIWLRQELPVHRIRIFFNLFFLLAIVFRPAVGAQGNVLNAATRFELHGFQFLYRKHFSASLTLFFFHNLSPYYDFIFLKNKQIFTQIRYQKLNLFLSGNHLLFQKYGDILPIQFLVIFQTAGIEHLIGRSHPTGQHFYRISSALHLKIISNGNIPAPGSNILYK
jgi:hypothetical protein